MKPTIQRIDEGEDKPSRFESMSPEHQERLRAAVGILITALFTQDKNRRPGGPYGPRLDPEREPDERPD